MYRTGVKYLINDFDIEKHTRVVIRPEFLCAKLLFGDQT